MKLSRVLQAPAVHEQQLLQRQKQLAPGAGSLAVTISEGLFLWTHFSWTAWSESPSGPGTCAGMVLI